MSGLSDNRCSVPPGVLVQNLGEEAVLLDLETERYFGLDRVGARALALLSGGATFDEAQQALLAEFDVEPDVLRNDFDALVADLVRCGLLEVHRG